MGWLVGWLDGLASVDCKKNRKKAKQKKNTKKTYVGDAASSVIIGMAYIIIIVIVACMVIVACLVSELVSFYSQLPHNSYPLVDSPRYELWYEFLCEPTWWTQEGMRCKGVWVIRAMGYERVDCIKKISIRKYKIKNKNKKKSWQLHWHG